MIPLLRKELGLTDEDAALSFAGEYTAEKNALLWSMQGDYSTNYRAAECRLLKNGGYRLIQFTRPRTYARDVVHVVWQAEDVVLVNNPDCRAVVYSDSSGNDVSKIELSPDDLPYVFLLKHPSGASECDFLDTAGNSLM